MINWGGWISTPRGGERYGVSRKTGIVYIHNVGKDVHTLFRTDENGDVMPMYTQFFDTMDQFNLHTQSL